MIDYHVEPEEALKLVTLNRWPIGKLNARHPPVKGGRRLQEAMKERGLRKRGEQPIDVAGHMSECSGVQDTG